MVLCGPFEALSQRLRTAAAGSKLSGYAVPSSFEIEVGESTDETIQTVSRIVRARRTPVKLVVPGSTLDAEVWGDETGRLLRLSIPAQSLEVVRDDIASVAARRVTMAGMRMMSVRNRRPARCDAFDGMVRWLTPRGAGCHATGGWS